MGPEWLIEKKITAPGKSDLTRKAKEERVIRDAERTSGLALRTLQTEGMDCFRALQRHKIDMLGSMKLYTRRSDYRRRRRRGRRRPWTPQSRRRRPSSRRSHRRPRRLRRPGSAPAGSQSSASWPCSVSFFSVSSSALVCGCCPTVPG